MTRTRCYRLVAVLLCAACLGGAAAGQSLDARFVDGLRQRRLFELAEKHCSDHLTRVEISNTQRAQWTIELIRTLAAHAPHESPAERDALWQRARQLAAEFEKASPGHPWRERVTLQDALTLLAQGELARQEFEAGLLAQQQIEPARQALREAGDLLQAMDKRLAVEIPLRRRSEPRPGELSADQLAAVQQQSRHQAARAARSRALLFAAGSDDRLALLLSATQTLDQLRTQLPAENPLLGLVELDLAEARRLLGHFDQAAPLLAGLSGEEIESSIRLAARAELLRLAIAQSDTAKAMRVLAEGRSIGGQAAADLDLARFEAYLWLARAATGDVAAARAYEEGAAEAAQLLAQHGPYWSRRADQLLIAALPRGSGGVNLELLTRAADGLYLQGDFERALSALDEAAGKARAGGDFSAAFTLAYKAGLIEQGRRKHAEAARRFRNLGRSLPTHPQAAQAHLAGAWHLGQTAADEAPAAQEYAGVLAEHLANWPASPTAAQARLWQGRLEASRGDFSAAIAAFAAVPRASEHFDAAISGLASATQQHLAQLAGTGESTAEPARVAEARLLKVIRDSGEAWPERWTAPQRAAALAAAQIMLAYRTGQAAEAEQLLRAALAGSTDALDISDEWLAAARSQLVIAIAAQENRAEEAAEILAKIGDASPAQLLVVADGLVQAARDSPPEARNKLAQIQLAAIDRLQPLRGKLTAEEQARLDPLRAAALAAAGRRDESLAAYAGLARVNPHSGTLQVAYGELLLAGDDEPSLVAALAQWRLISGRSRPRTDRWYQAKHAISLAQFKLGDKAEAATLLRYLLETPPGLKGTQWEARFAQLLKRCEQ